MEPDNKFTPDPEMTETPTSGSISGLKVIQPSQSLIEEVRIVQPQPPAQPGSVASGSAENTQAVPLAPVPVATASPVDAPASPAQAAASSIYPEPTKGIGIERSDPSVLSPQTADTVKAGDSSSTLFSRVTLLRKLVFVGVIGATLVVCALWIFRSVLLNSVAFLHFMTQSNGGFGLMFECLLYGAQLLILVSILALLVLVLSRSPHNVNKVLDVMGSITILNGILSLLSFNIVGVIFAVVFYRYLQSAEADVDLAGLGEKS